MIYKASIIYVPYNLYQLFINTQNLCMKRLVETDGMFSINVETICHNKFR